MTAPFRGCTHLLGFFADTELATSRNYDLSWEQLINCPHHLYYLYINGSNSELPTIYRVHMGILASSIITGEYQDTELIGLKRPTCEFW
ncbi:hypothetical protein SCLCIDRAFT_561070 [Scleroderma citrinum Foug A]|uniref:Uncharacterized protein n=1 Tax=Scleroderma citrinum Foug A TaxID=1036808 RepID=A0A0C3AJK8_9AGAM|nr:hypothetical protein SCLCIDRAFT_561070 [Scleroderma citrinum Foug A]